MYGMSSFTVYRRRRYRCRYSQSAVGMSHRTFDGASDRERAAAFAVRSVFVPRFIGEEGFKLRGNPVRWRHA